VPIPCAELESTALNPLYYEDPIILCVAWLLEFEMGIDNMKGVTSMKCPNCGKDLDEDAAFCKYCGAKAGAPAELASGRPAKRAVGLTNVILSLLVIALFAVVVYLIVTDRSSHTSSQAQVLVNDVFSIPAQSSIHYRFTLTRRAVVSGNFRAFGGGGNDVIVLVMDADSYVNWTNGHEVRVYYNSGQETVGHLSVPLSAGDYYLVFDNQFSLLTPKTVEAHINLAAR